MPCDVKDTFKCSSRNKKLDHFASAISKWNVKHLYPTQENHTCFPFRAPVPIFSRAPSHFHYRYKSSQLKHFHGFSSPFVRVGVCSSQTDHEPAVINWCPWLALCVRGTLTWRNTWGQTSLSQRDRISGHKHVLGNSQDFSSTILWPHIKHVERGRLWGTKTKMSSMSKTYMWEGQQTSAVALICFFVPSEFI